MGKSFRELKQENRQLRAEVKAMREEFVTKYSIKPGDLLVFRTRDLGSSFGNGVAALGWMERHIATAAGGPVVAFACKPEFTIEDLTVGDQKAMRLALDKLETLRRTALTKTLPEAPAGRCPYGCGSVDSVPSTRHLSDCRLYVKPPQECGAKHPNATVFCKLFASYPHKWHESGRMQWLDPKFVKGQCEEPEVHTIAGRELSNDAIAALAVRVAKGEIESVRSFPDERGEYGEAPPKK